VPERLTGRAGAWLSPAGWSCGPEPRAGPPAAAATGRFSCAV